MRERRPARVRPSLRPPPGIVDPVLKRLYREAMKEQGALLEAVRTSPIPIGEIDTELAGLSSDLQILCIQAQRISTFLEKVDRATLSERLDEVAARLQKATPSSAPTLLRTRRALAHHIRSVEDLAERRALVGAEIVTLISTLGSIHAGTVQLAVAADADAAARVRAQVESAHEQLRNTMALLEAQERRAAGSADAG